MTNATNRAKMRHHEDHDAAILVLITLIANAVGFVILIGLARLLGVLA